MKAAIRVLLRRLDPLGFMITPSYAWFITIKHTVGVEENSDVKQNYVLLRNKAVWKQAVPQEEVFLMSPPSWSSVFWTQRFETFRSFCEEMLRVRDRKKKSGGKTNSRRNQTVGSRLEFCWRNWHRKSHKPDDIFGDFGVNWFAVKQTS